MEREELSKWGVQNADHSTSTTTSRREREREEVNSGKGRREDLEKYFLGLLKCNWI